MALLDFLAFALVATLLSLVMFFANDFLKNSQSATSVWQPWVTAIGVIAAAFFVVWQQHMIAKREAEQRSRKSVAARAVMPAALAEICQYAQKCGHILKDIYPRTADHCLLAGSFCIPEFPSDAIKVLRDCIEHADKPHIEPIAGCIKRLQVQNSRLTSLLGKPSETLIHIHQIDSALRDVIELHACCSDLFWYARFETEEPDMTIEQSIFNSATICNIDEHSFPSLFKYMRGIKLIN
ncbi:hypothetical protein FM996_13020 [Methylosinus sporium]|uniref:Uncharacterized protein n=2 Tax=Methylosinus TaxID=425 RepID=A0A549SQT4_METSR|nr:hypothetical protein [Methylosinus sporium]TRL31985.1 hypothetical protein FM996_13020 [Methylosinus sporium]